MYIPSKWNYRSDHNHWFHLCCKILVNNDTDCVPWPTWLRIVVRHGLIEITRRLQIWTIQPSSTKEGLFKQKTTAQTWVYVRILSVLVLVFTEIKPKVQLWFVFLWLHWSQTTLLNIFGFLKTSIPQIWPEFIDIYDFHLVNSLEVLQV